MSLIPVQYLRGNDEACTVLATLYKNPSGLKFADLLSLCDMQSPELRSYLTKLTNYGVVCSCHKSPEARKTWYISKKTFNAVAALLARRGIITPENQVTAGA